MLPFPDLKPMHIAKREPLLPFYEENIERAKTFFLGNSWSDILASIMSSGRLHYAKWLLPSHMPDCSTVLLCPWFQALLFKSHIYLHESKLQCLYFKFLCIYHNEKRSVLSKLNFFSYSMVKRVRNTVITTHLYNLCYSSPSLKTSIHTQFRE